MAYTIPTDEPDSPIQKGTTVKFYKSFSDFPTSESWQLDYFINPELAASSPTPVNITATVPAGETRFLVTIPAATTADFPVGRVRWSAEVSLSGEVFAVGAGIWHTTPDPSATSDQRTHAQKMVDLLQAYITGQATGNVYDRTLSGYSIRRLTIEEARKELQYWQRVRVDELNAEQGGGQRRVIRYSFPNGGVF